MNWSRVAVGVGIVALAVGLLAIVDPGAVTFEADWILVSMIGVLFLLQGLRIVQRRRNAELDEAKTPDPELPVPTPAPGEELTETVQQFLGGNRIYYHRTRLQEGLRQAAVAVLTQYAGYTEEEATRAVENGIWIDDTDVATFLQDGRVDPSLRELLERTVTRESSLERRIRKTSDAIAAVAGVDVDRPSESPGDRAETGRFSTGRRGNKRRESPSSAAADGFGDPEGDDGTVRESHQTGHWRGVSAIALGALGVGVLVEQPAVLLAAVIGIGFAAYARGGLLAPDDISQDAISIDRTIQSDDPKPGEEVDVRVTVTNESERFLPDLRLVDGVPESLAVTDGSPRLGTALRPGETAAITYTLTARRGVHTFGPVLLVERDLPGATERERLSSIPTTITCRPELSPITESFPLRDQATPYVGRVQTSTAGDGVEFHSTREYRLGDPMNRIDWNRHARTGELTTIQFREERSAAVVIVIDDREPAYVSPEPHARHALDRSVDAAGRLLATLSDAGNRVGIATTNSGSCWLAPGAGEEHRLRARKLLATHPTLTPVPPDGYRPRRRWERTLRKRLSRGTQILLLTPLCDEYPARLARRLDAHGHPVTVVSPDPTADRTPGHRLSAVARRLRTTELRNAGIPVVDWEWERSLDSTVARYRGVRSG